MSGTVKYLSTLDHSYLSGSRAHDPLKLRSIVSPDLDALRQGRHTKSPSSLDRTSNEFGKDYDTPSTIHELHR
jgi:hypothetical protein